MTGRSWRTLERRHAALACAALAALVASSSASSSCYSTGTGTSPPFDTFYYPVGLAVSAAGNVLYVANSDFDLQWNGGTVQSYDLNAIRQDTVRLILGLYPGAPSFDAGLPVEAGPLPADAGPADAAPADAAPAEGGPDDGGPFEAGIAAGPIPDAGPLPFEAGVQAAIMAGCPNTTLLPAPLNPNDPDGWNNEPGRLPLGQGCAPPMDSRAYVKDAIQIGAFATDAQLSKDKARLFVPVRGDATLTWMDVVSDNTPNFVDGPPPHADKRAYPPFGLTCGQNPASSCPNCCDSRHHAGQRTDQGNTRQTTMPGEPFAMAFSEDGTAIAITHLAPDPNNLVVGDTSLFLSGFVPAIDAGPTDGTEAYDPSIQYYTENMPLGGDGIVAIPHDLAALADRNPADPLRPGWLQVSNQSSEIDLVRYYTNEGYQSTFPVVPDGGVLVDAGVALVEGSMNLRPFIMKERPYLNAVEANGSNSRGIAIDPTPRIACEQAALASGLSVTSAEYVTCAQTPARVFIASRLPSSLIVGQIGSMSEEDGTYDPDALTLLEDVSISGGPSNVYVAPIVDGTGRYSLRVFVVCFDSQTIAIYNPDTHVVENQVTTGPGPFAMAFDPFDLIKVAKHALVPFESNNNRSPYTIISKNNPAIDGENALRTYRFAYVASFTDSYVQILDLDQSFQDDRLMGVPTFETMVYTLGLPVQPVQAN